MSEFIEEIKEKLEKHLTEKECANSRSVLYDEDGYYIGPTSEYHENGIDSRTGEPFYGMRRVPKYGSF